VYYGREIFRWDGLMERREGKKNGSRLTCRKQGLLRKISAKTKRI
jgi:hypothetical protein